MSGAKNCPETTRQKMIGMMYLVLTAMLALNVSTQVLRGFTRVDNSLHASITSTEARINNQYQLFELARQKNELKVQAWYDKAMNVQQKSDSLFNYIENFKKAMLDQSNIEDSLKTAGLLPEDGIDNFDISSDYVINKKNGKILKVKIDEFREYISEVFEGNITKTFVYNTIFSTEKVEQKDKSKVDWEYAWFNDTPVSAAVTVLTKYQNDIRTAEIDMIQYLFGRTDEEDVRVNKMQAFVIPTSRNVFLGSEFSADIVLAAVDSTARPIMYVNGSQIPVNEKTGVGLYKRTANAIGTQDFSGYIMLPNDEKQTKYEFPKMQYFVSEPIASVNNTDLNVVFLGMDNNFNISVPGIAPDNIRVDVNGGGAAVTSKGSGRYIIKPSSMGEVKITVFAKAEGKESQMDSKIFKVKRLPRPSVFLQDKNGNEKEGSMSIADLKGATVIASYGPDALIAANFTVTTFTMAIEGLPTKIVSGQKLDIEYLNKLTRGKQLTISNIKATGPGGEQTLGAVVVRAM